MMTITCPGCGAPSTVPESEIGMPALCLRCGARYTVPAPIASGPTSSSQATTFSGVLFSSNESLKEVAPDWPEEPTPRAHPTQPAAGAGRSYKLWLPFVALLLAGGVVGAAVIAAVLPLTRRTTKSDTVRTEPSRPADLARPTTDPIDYATARALKEEAESLVISNRLVDAHRKYQELFDRAGDEEPQDPRTRQLLASARTHQERLYDAVLGQLASQPRTPGTAPATAQTGETNATADPPTAVAGGNATVAPTPPTPATAPSTNPVASVPSTQPSIASTQPTTSPTTQVAGTANLPTSRPVVQKKPEPPAEVSDRQIGQAIRKGVDYLLSQFSPTTHALTTSGNLSDAHAGGENALAVYALLQCGLALPEDQRLSVRGDAMRKKIDAMKRANLTEGHPQVYALGIRATALSLFNRKEDEETLRSDVQALLRAHHEGAYSYSAHPEEGPEAAKTYADNSNSQYGLLGVWSGAEAGVEIPSAYWAAVNQHWESTQNANGQWDYAASGQGGTLSMTVAGIASLFVTHDWLFGPKSGAGVGRPPFSPPLQRGLKWLETGENYSSELQRGGKNVPYTMYGLERVGLASGFKYFGEHDWYRELSREAVLGQGGDGSWNGNVVDTSFVLLFLARGRHPILMNKLRFDRPGPARGAWSNRPRDLANLAHFASRQLERELNWQVVPLSRPWQEWLDAPVLYLASHQPVELTDQDLDNLRGFIAAGGLLFTHADGDSASFNEFAEDLAHRLFPRYELRDLHLDHDVYTAVFKIEQKPRLRVVENGSRLLIVHSTTDLSRNWQTRDRARNRGAFELGVNLFIYAAGKRDLRNRLDSTFIADPGPPAQGQPQISLARLSYPGNWDPEPYAFTRLSRWFQWETGIALVPREVRVSSLRPGEVAVAHLTGTARHDFSQADVAAVRAFVEAGGVLFVDQCGGTGVFDKSVQERLLSAAFPDAKPQPVSLEHALLRSGAPGMQDLTAVKLRPYTVEREGKEAGLRLSILPHGKGHVLFTPLDVTSGLLGTRTWGIHGYDPDYALALLKNVLLWTADGQSPTPRVAPPPPEF